MGCGSTDSIDSGYSSRRVSPSYSVTRSLQWNISDLRADTQCEMVRYRGGRSRQEAAGHRRNRRSRSKSRPKYSDHHYVSPGIENYLNNPMFDTLKPYKSYKSANISLLHKPIHSKHKPTGLISQCKVL